MKSIIPAFVIFLVSSVCAYSEPVSFQATTANIAAWNLAGFNAIPAEKAKTFTDAIAYIDPEVLALVEINPDSIVDQITAELKSIGICYKRAIVNQTARQTSP